jgi:copper transport protein
MKMRCHPAVLAAVLLFSLAVSQVRAHANLVRAEPAANSIHPTAPTSILLVFSEALEPAGSNIELLGADGQPLPTARATVESAAPTNLRLTLPPLAPGLYTVTWKALSTVDGHLTTGVYAFGVGEEADLSLAPPATTGPAPGSFAEARPLDVLARILSLLGGALLTGGLGLHLLLWHPLQSLLALAGTAADQRLARLLTISLALSWAGALLTLLVQGQAIGSPAAVGAFLLTSRFGQALTARLILLLLLSVTIWLVGRRSGRVLWLGLGLSAGILTTINAISHSAAVEQGRWAAILTDWAHLLVASIWVGGLTHLLYVCLPSLRALPDQHQGAVLLARRFTMLGIAAVVSLLITGIYSTWLHVGSLAALRTTAYGQTLLLKLVLIVPLLALAAANLRFGRRPVLPRAATIQGFRRTLGAETLTGLLVLAVVGVLTGLGPAKSAVEARQSEALSIPLAVEPLQGELMIRPPRPGPARFEVRLITPDGTPYTVARRIRLKFTPPNPSLGVNTATAEHEESGRYVTEGSYLTLPGAWQVEIQLQRPDGYDLFSRTVLLVDRTILPPATTIDGFEPGTWLSWGLVLGGLGLALLACWLRFQREHVATAPLVLGVGLILLIAGRLQQLELGNQPFPTINPMPPTQASITQGRELYSQSCVQCHGPSAKGDGPLAVTLNPPPLDLNVHAPLHDDTQLFAWISKGIPGTAMPAHETLLSEEQRWHIVNYLRALTEGGT